MGHRRSCALGWYRPSVGVPDTFKAVDNSVPCRVSVCDNAVIPIYSVQCRSLDFELPVSDSVAPSHAKGSPPQGQARHHQAAPFMEGAAAPSRFGRGESGAPLSPLTPTPGARARGRGR